MASDPVSEPKSLLKNPLMYSSAVLVVAAARCCVCYVFRAGRIGAISNAKRRRNARRSSTKQDRLAVEQLGGKELAILSFYASPTTIRRGESAQTLLRCSERQDR